MPTARGLKAPRQKPPEPVAPQIAVHRAVITVGGAPVSAEPEPPEEDETIRPLSDRLVTKLTAHRTLALRDSIANDAHVAFQAVLHALCLGTFYRHASGTCLEITAKNSGFSAQAPGLAEAASAKAIDARHANHGAQSAQDPCHLSQKRRNLRRIPFSRRGRPSAGAPVRGGIC